MQVHGDPVLLSPTRLCLTALPRHEYVGTYENFREMTSRFLWITVCVVSSSRIMRHGQRGTDRIHGLARTAARGHETFDVLFPTCYRVTGVSAMRWTQSSLPFIGALTLLAVLAAPDALDAKRKKRAYRPPIKIVNVTPSPVPFLPGDGSSLSLAVTVELPGNVNETDVLEVSSLISFPSKRSIRFLYDRQPLNDVVMENGKPRKRLILLWDGKDQNHQYVDPGEYAYAVRAKLMAEEHGFVKAKTVSLFTKGTLNVSSPPDIVEPVDTVGHPDADVPPSPEAGTVSRTQDDEQPEAAGHPHEPDAVP